MTSSRSPAVKPGNLDAPAERFEGVPIGESLRLDPVMRLTAKHMLASHAQTAPVTVLGEADATQLVRIRDLLAARSGVLKVTYSHLLIKLVAAGLRDHPRLNAALDGDTVKVFDEINIGMAMALPDGNLVVPVIHLADRLSVDEIAARATDLQTRGRSGKLTTVDMQRATFTLSNAGMLSSVRWITPLLNPPQCAILATGAITERAVVRDGVLCVRWIVELSITFDHRALNGFAVSKFLDTLVGLIVEPAVALGLPEEPLDPGILQGGLNGS